jgi:hypothetical protein
MLPKIRSIIFKKELREKNLLQKNIVIGAMKKIIM